MKQVDKISVKELKEKSLKMYDPMVKGVVDLAKGFLVIDAEMHVDEEQFLLENGSKQSDLWGINLYPDKFGTKDFIEFDSMINIRPRQNNKTRTVEDPKIQEEIRTLVEGVVHE